MEIATAIMLFGLGQVVHPGIVHHWSADGDATDNVGEADGTMNGDVGYADGVWGQSFDFNGGHIDFGDIANFGQSDWSVSLWVQIDNFDDNVWRAIVGKRDICNDSSFWELRKLYNNDVYGVICNSPTCNYVWSQFENEWHHLALIRSNNDIFLYVDGIFAAGLNADLGILDNDAHMIAGTSICQTTDGTQPLQGRIDELQIYYRALSQLEVEELATAVIPPVCSADFNEDGFINASDLAVLLGFWGIENPLFGDLDADGDVDAFDLAMLLGSWGVCD